MTTSGVTDWSLTARDIMVQAAIELGIPESGAVLTAEEEVDCMVRLNAMLKSWQGQASLFHESTGTITVPAASASGTLPATMRNVSSVRHVVSATNHRTLSPFNRGQYYMLPNKTAVGNPSIYYLSQQAGGDVMYIWPVPAAGATLAVDYARTVETVTDGTETLDIPQDWHETVILGLASRIAGMFGASRADPANVADVKQRAERLYQQKLDEDRPDNYFFESNDYCCYS